MLLYNQKEGLNKMRYRINIKRFLTFITIVIIAIIVVWFAVSYGEVLGKNLSGNVELANWNFFKVFGDIS